jgi:hypothetical protein
VFIKLFKGDNMILSKEKKQELLIAKLRKQEIERKVKAQKMQSSGYIESQHAVLTKETRLVNNGHFMKSGNQLELDFLRARKLKIMQEKTTKIVLVKKV